MKWTTLTALTFALAAAGVGLTYVLTRPPQPPAEVLAEVRGEMDDVLFDESAALRRLDRAIETTRGDADPSLAVELMQTRIEIYRRRGAYDRARADIETLLATARRGDRDLELELARLEAVDDQPAAALQRTRSLLQREPDFAAGWELCGDLEESVALRALEEVFTEFDYVLAREDARRAREIITELAARHEDDPANANLRYQLGQIFVAVNQADLYGALSVIAQPRAAFDRARAAYARANALEPSAGRVVGLARTLETAGQLKRAIELGQAAQTLDPIRQDADAVAQLLEDLAAADRAIEARPTLAEWSWEKGGTFEFYRAAGETMYRAGDFSSMAQIALGLRRLGGETGRRWSWFFGSLAPIRRARDLEDTSRLHNALRRSAESLRNFVQDDAYVEPFYGAKTEAWFWIAEAYQHLGLPSRELDALQRGLAIRPEHSAQAWVRVAEATKAGKRKSWKAVEAAYSEALHLAPERTRELEADWLEAGTRVLRGQGLTMEELYDEIAQDRSIVPLLRKVGPAALTMIARDHLAKERPVAAMQAAERARRDYPGLIPPMDVIISVKLQEPERFDVERDIVRRIEAAGIDDEVEQHLERLPAGRLRGEALIRAIRAAPSRFGKPAVARWFQERGDSDSAAQALAGLDPESAPASLLMLRARTSLDEGRFADALEQLEYVDARSRSGQEAILLRAEAHVGANDTAKLDALARQVLAEDAGTTPDVLLSLTDILMKSGREDLALAIVDRLDSDPETRTADFYRRRVLVDVLTEEQRGPEPALESIDRSEAYLRDGTPEITAIVFAVKRRQWTDLPQLVQRLRESNLEISPEQEIALMLLEERFEAGRRAALEGLEASPKNASLAFLAATADALVDAEIELPPWFGPPAAKDALRLFRGRSSTGARDPREALIVFLLSDVEGWAPWLLRYLERTREESGSRIWSRWLEARILDASGDSKRLRRTSRKLVEVAPTFGPGHDLAVRLMEETFPTEPLNPNVVQARSLRLKNLGADLIDDPAEIALARAGVLARKGETVQAVQTLETALDDPGDTEVEVRLTLGALLIRANQPSLAAQHLFAAALGEPGVFETVVIDSLLFSLRLAIEAETAGTPQRGAIDRPQALAMLDRLSRRYPTDPIVALAELVTADVAEGERAVRARVILETLHERSGRRTLESLRPGSSRPWVQALTPIAADVAYEFVSRDLAIEPGSLELWQLLGVAADAAGRADEARAAYETLLAIDPRAETGYALAEILIQEGSDRSTLKTVLGAADRAQGGGSIRSNYLRALAESRRLKPNLDKVIQPLENLWSVRKRAAREVDPLDIGLLYASALFKRQTPEDLATLRKVLGDLRKIAKDDLYAEDVVVAMRGIQRKLAAQQEAAASAAESDG